MITKSIYANGSKGHHKFTLNVQEDSTSSSNNSSLLSFKFIISATHSSWQWRSYNNITYSITIGTNTYTGTIPNFNGNTTTIRSVSGIEIEHNNDGTKTINVGFSVTDPNTSVNYTCGNASESSTMVLSDLHTPPSINEVEVIELRQGLSQISDINHKIVQYFSSKQYTITANAFDSTITKYRLYNGDELLEERVAEIAYPNRFTISYSNKELQKTKIGNKNYAIVRFEVEDSKGGIGTRTMPLEIIEYQKPNIIATSSEIKRNGQSTGKVNLNLIATFYGYQIGSYYNDANTMSMSFAYWAKGASESTTYYPIDITSQNPDVSISGSNLTITNWTMQKNGADIDDVGTGAYYFKIKLQDDFGRTSTVTLLCSSSEYVMCKFDDKVDFKKATQKHKPLLASAEFDKTNFQYIVLDNGLAMCWYQETVNKAITNSWNGGYLSGAITLPDFPIEFQNPPIVFKSLDNVNYTAIITSAISNASATTTNPGSLQLFRTASTNAQDYKINILAIGQIKSN